MKTTPQSVIVVGAGAAGIKLAHTLASAAKDAKITVLEANDYIGGRVRNFQFQGHTVEMGANWISGRETVFDNPIWRLASAIGIQGHLSERDDPAKMVVLDCTTGADVAAEYLEQTKRFDAIYSAALEARKGATAEPLDNNIGVRAILEQYGWTPKDQLSDLERAVEHNVLEVWVTETLEELSAKFDLRPGANDVELGQDELFVEDSRGFNSIFRGMVRDLEQGGKTTIHLETQVQSIHYAPGDVKVVAKDCKTGTVTEYQADAVVSTVSLGVLQSGAIAFVPPLPEWKVEALNQVKMFNFAKVYAKFERPLWSDDKDYLVFINKGEESRGHFPFWMKYKNTKDDGNRNRLLMCYLGGAQARRVESMNEEQLKDEIEDLFGRGFGRSKDCRPVAVAVTDWSRNPRFCGSYSYIPKAAFATVPYANYRRALTGREDGDLEDATTDATLPNTLYFAGEAFDDKYNAWIQGGYLSGERVAKSILGEE